MWSSRPTGSSVKIAQSNDYSKQWAASSAVSLFVSRFYWPGFQQGMTDSFMHFRWALNEAPIYKVSIGYSEEVFVTYWLRVPENKQKQLEITLEYYIFNNWKHFHTKDLISCKSSPQPLWQLLPLLCTEGAEGYYFRWLISYQVPPSC